MSATTTTEETVMGQVIPSPHRTAVLKSHHNAVRALLVVALVALAATVVILASNGGDSKVSVAPKSAQVLPPGTRFDGGPDEGTRGIQVAPPAPGTRFDGGPDEGTRGPQTYVRPAGAPSSYQAPGKDSSERTAPPVIPMGPGGR
jgi:hypothetical protein